MTHGNRSPRIDRDLALNDKGDRCVGNRIEENVGIGLGMQTAKEDYDQNENHISHQIPPLPETYHLRKQHLPTD